MTKPIDDKQAERHRAKMAKRKARQDEEVAGKTVEKGLLIVHTGTGKGKSTAAFGLALRMLGRGKRIGVVQFIKGAWHTAERDALAKFGDQVSWHTMGEGFTWETQDLEPRHRRGRARLGQGARADGRSELRRWSFSMSSTSRFATTTCRSIDVVATLKARRPDLHVIVTGRNAKPELIEAADLVTEMTLVKHHFAAGVKAQEGIEF